MSRGAPVEKYGSSYRIRGVDPFKLDHIPGMKTWPDGNATGPIDAIAVALKRLKREADEPELPMPNPLTYSILRNYQNDGVSWLAHHLTHENGAILADDMGLGKTAQTIHTWKALGQPQMLVVCPASVRKTWFKELDKWANVQPVLVDSGKKASALAPASPVVISSYELVGKLPEEYEPSMLVMDEAHLLRGRGASRSRRLLDFGKACTYRLALTGTPLWSRPRDLWMLLRILYPNYRFGTAQDFDYAYCGAYINEWGGRINKGATRSDELKQRMSYVMLRRTKEEVAKDLPTLQRTFRWVEGTAVAKKMMEAFILRKCSLTDALNATLEAKFDESVSIAKEAGKFLLFTWQKVHAKELWRRLNEDEETPCELITGDISHKERALTVARAAKNGHGVVATIDSCGVGVDGLQQVASVGIFHALDYVPIKLAQAEARLHRIGQTLPVQWVYVCMEGSADVFVADTIVDKLDQWRGVMGRDSTARIRDDVMGSGDVSKSEQEALSAIYAAMADGGDDGGK